MSRYLAGLGLVLLGVAAIGSARAEVFPPPLGSPTASALGGMYAESAPANQFMTGIATTGHATFAQPSASNLSNGVTGSGAVVLAASPAVTGTVTGGATYASISLSGAVAMTGGASSPPTNGFYLATTGALVSPGISALDGTKVLRFLKSSEAGQSPSDGFSMGYGAAASFTGGGDGPIIALGQYSLPACTTCDHEIGLGPQSLFSDVTGSHNTALGIDTISLAVAPTSTVAVGEHGFHDAATVTRGIAMGSGAGYHAVSVTSSILVGYQSGQTTALNSWTTGNDIGIGDSTFLNATGSTNSNIAIGPNGLQNCNGCSSNVALGGGTGITTGTFDVMVKSGNTLQTGSNNFVVLGDVQASNTSTALVVGVGAKGGSGDTVYGYQANSAVNNANKQRTVIGNFALHSATSGVGITAVGHLSGAAVTTGTGSFFGANVGPTNCTSGTNILLAGTSSSTDCSVPGASNEIHIGAGSTDIFFTSGTGTPSTSLTNIAGNLYTGSTLALATNATGPFLYAPTMAGAPSGTPAQAQAGQSALAVDSTGHKLCWFEQANTAWKCATGS